MTDRLGRLVDRHLYNTDAQYHADVRRVSHLIEMTRMALEDEDVAPDVIERVVNRLVYGVPSGADAYERAERLAWEMKLALLAPLQPLGAFRG